MANNSHFEFLKINSTNMSSISRGKVCFHSSLQGMKSRTKIRLPPPFCLASDHDVNILRYEYCLEIIFVFECAYIQISRNNIGDITNVMRA